MDKNSVLCVALPTIGAMYIAYVAVTKADGIVFATAVGAVTTITGYLYGKSLLVKKGR